MTNITINDITIQIIKKNIKNIRLSVHPPDGRVRLAVPVKMDDAAIKDFATSKILWIEKQKSKFYLQDKQIEHRFISGEEHLYLGEKYMLKVLETSGKQYVELDNQKNLNLYIRPNSTIEKREQLINKLAEENAASTEESSAAIEEQTAGMEEIARSSEQLAGLAEELNKLVVRFKV